MTKENLNNDRQRFENYIEERERDLFLREEAVQQRENDLHQRQRPTIVSRLYSMRDIADVLPNSIRATIPTSIRISLFRGSRSYMTDGTKEC